MVKYEQLERTFAALADPTRCAMVDRLAAGDRSLGELGEGFAMTLPAVFKHVRVLEDAGLVRTWKTGRIRMCRLEPAGMREADAWLERASARWERRLDRLTKHLEVRG